MADIQRIGVGNSSYPAIDEAVIYSSDDIFLFDSNVITFDSTTDTFDEQI